MELKKQDVGVWVKASEELPEPNLEVPIRFLSMGDNLYHYGSAWLDEKGGFGYKKIFSAAYGWYRTENIEWLKPIKDVYVFTSDELEKIMWDYGNNCANDGSSFSELTKPKQFLESIKQ